MVDTRDIENREIVVMMFYCILQLSIISIIFLLIRLYISKERKLKSYLNLCQKYKEQLLLINDFSFITLIFNILIGQIYHQLGDNEDKKIKNVEWFTFVVMFPSLFYGYMKHKKEINDIYDNNF